LNVKVPPLAVTISEKAADAVVFPDGRGTRDHVSAVSTESMILVSRTAPAGKALRLETVYAPVMR
jgi:hypothetical protein